LVEHDIDLTMAYHLTLHQRHVKRLSMYFSWLWIHLVKRQVRVIVKPRDF